MTARLLTVELDPICPPGTLADAAADAGVELVIVQPAAGAELPADLGGYAGLAVLGGSMDLADAGAFPYLHDAVRLVQVAADHSVPALGICLGSQVAAAALGGRAYRAAEGVEVGWLPLELNDAGRADAVLGAVPHGTEVFQWHHDTFDLPPGATLLAAGTHFPHAFVLGSVRAVQFHPEVDREILAEWYARPDAESDGYPFDRAVERVADRAAAVLPLLDAFCRLVARAGGPLHCPPPATRCPQNPQNRNEEQEARDQFGPGPAE